MGLFDKSQKSQAQTAIKLNGAESFAAILVVAMAADGYATTEEIRTLRDDLYRMQLFATYDGEEMTKLLEKLLGILKKQGADALFAGARAGLSAELNDTAYAVAADMVLSDGTFADEEKVFLDRLAEALGIEDATAEMLVQAMLIKNKG